MGKLIQFQTHHLNLTLNLLEQIRRRRICILQEFESPLGKLIVRDLKWQYGSVRASVDKTVMVLRREPFNSDAIINYLPSKLVQIVQPVQVSLSTIEQLRQAGEGTPPAVHSIDLELIFNVEIHHFTNGVFLSISFHDIERMPAGIQGFNQFKEMIAKEFPTRRLPIDVGKISGLGGQPQIANVGIAAAILIGDYVTVANPHHMSVYTPGSVVLIRIELGPYPVHLNAWEQFYSAPQEVAFFHDITSTGGRTSLGWDIFMDEFFITSAARQEIEESLAGSSDFRLKGGITSAWSAPEEGRGDIHLDFFGDAVNVCKLWPFGSSNIGLRVNVRMELSVIEPKRESPRDYDPGSLRQFVKINHWKNNLDTARCVAGIGAIWPLLGLKLIEEKKLKWFQLVLSFLAPPLITILSLVEANKGGRFPSPKLECVRPDSDKDEFICTMPFDLEVIPLGGLPELHKLQARADGVILSGFVFWKKRLGRQFHLTSISTRAFELVSQTFNCNQIGSVLLALISEHPDSFAFYRASITLGFELHQLDNVWNNRALVSTSTSNADIIPPYICSARVRPEDDPLNVFAPYITIEDSSPYFKTITVNVPLSTVPPQYFSTDFAYPCRVLIQTSDGTRMITLPPIEKASEEEVKNSTLGTWAHGVSECYAKSERYNPQWIIDPSDFYREQHRWEAVVSGLQPSEQITLQNNGGRVVASAHASQQGMAFLHAIVSPADYDGQLNIQRSVRSSIKTSDLDTEGQMKALESRQIPVIDIKQSELLLGAEITIDEFFVGVTPVMLGSHSTLMVVEYDTIAVYDLTHVGQPLLLMRQPMAGISGLLATGREVLAWGEHGAFSLNVDLSAGDLIAKPVFSGPIEAMVSSGHRTLILQQGILVVWDSNHSQEAVMEIPEACCLAASATHVLIGTPHNVMIYENTIDGLQRTSEHPVQNLHRILWSGMRGNDNEFVLEGREGTELIDVSDREQITVLERYPEDWELNALISHNEMLIEVDRTGSRLKIFATGKSAWQ